MKRYNKQLGFLFFLSVFLLVLVGCSGFSGIRNPLYDGRKVEPDTEAIATYHQSREVTGDEKDYYFRYPFSEAMTAASLDYPNEEPVLLVEGEYTIGEDLPAGRATLLGNQSVFTSENNEVHVGNFVIRDQAGEVYFENLFHTDYGQLVVQVDLISGHTIEIIGTDAEITLFYSPTLSEDPYVLMDPPELLVNLERIETQQPIVIDAENETIRLTAGIYEVGEHLEPGTYEITGVQAVHNTEMYLFHEGEEARVFELLVNNTPLDDDEDFDIPTDNESPAIELETGDKIYPSLVYSLELSKVGGE